MFVDSKNVLKSKMLDEFEKELDQIFEDYEEEIISYEKCISQIKILISAWNHCRLDLINKSDEGNSIQIIKNNKLHISYPSWFESDDGKGCQLVSNTNEIKVLFKSNNEGMLNITLRGLDYTDYNKKRLPTYVNCIYLKVDEKTIFDEGILVWHDDPYRFNKEYVNEEEIRLILKFETIYDYFPLLKVFLTNVIDRKDLYTKYEKIKSYISYERLLIRINDMETEVYNAIIKL